jgi:riboflavin kinase / FMN adenylyltransferase
MAQHFLSLDEVALSDSWLTIGSFDGVHLGHQAIVGELVSGAHIAGLPAVVLTFFPHPAVVLRNRQEFYYLTSPDERAELLGHLDVDLVITIPFTHDLASMSAFDFMAMLRKRLHPSHLWVGYDFALGHNREGDVPRLRQLGQELGYSLNVMQPIQTDGNDSPLEIISSSSIRAALAGGDLAKVGRQLGRPYSIKGEIVHGDGRGRLLGVPTANLELWPHRVLPKTGVYVCQAQIDDQIFGAVSNIGFRPTFENQPATPRVETHILDFDRDLYGKTIRLDFLHRLRDELRFSSIDMLVAQIQADISQARSFLLSQNLE